MIKKLTIIKILVGGVVLVAVLGIGLYTNTIKLPIEKEIHTQYVADFSDDRILMGASHNVFVGKVIRETGTKDTGIVPETQFEVEVVLNIKGDLQGTATINQIGGYKDGILYTVHGGDVLAPNTEKGDTLLRPGVTYLFTSRYNKDEGWHTISSHPNGRKVISEDRELDGAQLKDLAMSDEKVRRLQGAYKNEILLEDDIRMNNTRNSYQSLQNTK